ncbi:MAG: site-2 protease family protein [Verrucomicrobiae bacterium]|nr:site-2 protease family protein [Verrucomicrobiae bacterium]
MLPSQQGSFKLFRLAGIQVYLHWTWFLVAAYMIYSRLGEYSSPLFNVLEYVSLFGIVLMHEFGHALACRQTGGYAEQIVLWPLGGVAFVDPPRRPGATLWSIAAGPLVNVVLFPLLGGLVWLAKAAGYDYETSDVGRYLLVLFVINGIMLGFNLLPVYPLDGGQIVWSLLWFIIGRAKALLVASTIGIIGVIGLFIVALLQGSAMLFIMSIFILMNCWRALLHARHLARLEDAARHHEFICPDCGAVPPAGPYWICARCGRPFDTFATGGTCPYCLSAYDSATCPNCHHLLPISLWRQPPPLIPPRIS